MKKDSSALFGTAVALAIVAEVLVLAATTAQVPAPPRAAATSLARPTTPAKAPDADGFLQRWLLLEPIKVPGQLTESAVQGAVKMAPAPAIDEQQGTQADTHLRMPKDGEAVTVGGESLLWHAVDTLGYNVNLFHFVYALNKPTSNVLFWAVTIVDSPREMSNVRLAIGSNAASIWWLNGAEVVHLYNDRQTVVDDGVSKRVTLKKGPNLVRAAIVNAGGATDFCARFLDEHDAPIKTLTVSLSAEGK